MTKANKSHNEELVQSVIGNKDLRMREEPYFQSKSIFPTPLSSINPK